MLRLASHRIGSVRSLIRSAPTITPPWVAGASTEQQQQQQAGALHHHSSLVVPTHSGRRYLHVEQRLVELDIALPPAPKPKANYNIVCRAAPGNMLYISGHLPVQTNGTLLTGRIGPGGESVAHGYAAARQCALNIIATLQQQLGDLDRVEQIVKIFGIVQSTDDFKEQHLVMDGCSDLIMQVFGKEVGYHARSAIGTSTLPLDMSVEVEAIVQIKPN